MHMQVSVLFHLAEQSRPCRIRGDGALPSVLKYSPVAVSVTLRGPSATLVLYTHEKERAMPKLTF